MNYLYIIIYIITWFIYRGFLYINKDSYFVITKDIHTSFDYDIPNPILCIFFIPHLIIIILIKKYGNK